LVNHFISASAILKSTTLSHSWYQVKFSDATLSQNFLVHELIFCNV
jgi:hypothetical protein